MTKLYADSSAVIAWLLGEAPGAAMRSALVGAELIVASSLTLIECDRALVRAAADHRVTETVAADRRGLLSAIATNWYVLEMDGEIVERARRPFPSEPIRTLDALHLASALAARAAVPGLALLSLDTRVRESGRGLGFAVFPEVA